MKTFTVIYQTGGTENFRWNRVPGSFNHEQAVAKRDELQRAGYPALIDDYQRSLNVGLPETFYRAPSTK